MVLGILGVIDPRAMPGQGNDNFIVLLCRGYIGKITALPSLHCLAMGNWK